MAGHLQPDSHETRQVPSQGLAINSPPFTNPNLPTQAETMPTMFRTVDSGLVTSSSEQQQGMNANNIIVITISTVERDTRKYHEFTNDKYCYECKAQVTIPNGVS